MFYLTGLCFLLLAVLVFIHFKEVKESKKSGVSKEPIGTNETKKAKKQAVSRYEAFLSDCNKIIIGYENDMLPSCGEDLIKSIKTITDGAKEQINQGLIPSEQYKEFVHKLLSNCSFDLLASGKYHIYRGQLNQMSCAYNLKAVHEKSLEFAVRNNIISQKEKEKEIEYLNECINKVG